MHESDADQDYKCSICDPDQKRSNCDPAHAHTILIWIANIRLWSGTKKIIILMLWSYFQTANCNLDPKRTIVIQIKNTQYNFDIAQHQHNCVIWMKNIQLWSWSNRFNSDLTHKCTIVIWIPSIELQSWTNKHSWSCSQTCHCDLYCENITAILMPRRQIQCWSHSNNFDLDRRHSYVTTNTKPLSGSQTQHCNSDHKHIIAVAITFISIRHHLRSWSRMFSNTWDGGIQISINNRMPCHQASRHFYLIAFCSMVSQCTVNGV